MLINLDMCYIIWYNINMFIKLTKSGKNEYAYIVRSYREDGVTKHEYLFNLGRFDEIQNNPSFERLGLRILELAQSKRAVDLGKVSEAETVNWGYLVYKKLWDEFELARVLGEIQKCGKTQFSLSDACFLMVIEHLLSPRSKLATYDRQGRYINLPEVKLQHLYRALDKLDLHKETLEDTLYFRRRNLFNRQVDVVFYDVTTFSFESVKADTLRDFGYSKDGKANEIQVVLGLLIDADGCPIGYELFPGNTFEGSTLETALEKLEKRFGLRRVIIVADRGINSKVNLKRITDRGYSYIFASRIRRMGKKIEELIFDPAGYNEFASEKDGMVRYKVVDYTNHVTGEDGKKVALAEKLIITYSDRRAKKDRADRLRLIEKAHSLLEDPGKIKATNKRDGKKYLKNTNQETWLLDMEAIARDERFDGYYAIQTNETELPATEILEAYRTLWKIEESFKIMKSTLEVRPVFHWTEPRIKGHFVVCFLAFLLERTLEFKLARAGVEGVSPERIREALNTLNFAEIEIEGRKLLIKTKGTELSSKILKAMRIKHPKNVSTPEELTL